MDIKTVTSDNFVTAVSIMEQFIHAAVELWAVLGSSPKISVFCVFKVAETLALAVRPPFYFFVDLQPHNVLH